MPLEAVTESFAILAKRGSGKTYTAKVMVEEMLSAGLPVCIIDPLGVWWGLRSSEDGRRAGEPVIIFGGDHADVPLEHTAGELLADLVVDESIAAVLDLSAMSKTQSRQFVTDFAERLYRRNRDPLHLVVDEADSFAPQRTTAASARCLGAMQDLARRGRTRGLGLTLISQRAAVLNKDLLTQAEVLIAMRMNGPRDVAAIDEWVSLHAEESQAAKLKASLPSLPVGTAWVWSPGWLGILQRVAVRRARTFDSSSTPKPGQRRAEPKRMAPVDLAALGDRIAATVERAKSEDPRELRARIAQLERQLADRPTPQVEVIEVPIVTEESLAALRSVQTALSAATTDLADVLAPVLAGHRPAPAAAAPRPASQPPSPGRTMPPTAPATTRPPDGTPLPKAQRAILSVLATYGPRTKTQVAILAGYAHNGGGYNNALGALRGNSLISGRDQLEITAAGGETLGPVVALPSGRALLEHWTARLGKAERLILDALHDIWPQPTTKEALATTTGYTASGGGFNNALGKLRSLELIEGRAEIRLSDELAAT